MSAAIRSDPTLCLVSLPYWFPFQAVLQRDERKRPRQEIQLWTTRVSISFTSKESQHYIVVGAKLIRTVQLPTTTIVFSNHTYRAKSLLNKFLVIEKLELLKFQLWTVNCDVTCCICGWLKVKRTQRLVTLMCLSANPLLIFPLILPQLCESGCSARLNMMLTVKAACVSTPVFSMCCTTWCSLKDESLWRIETLNEAWPLHGPILMSCPFPMKSFFLPISIMSSPINWK